MTRELASEDFHAEQKSNQVILKRLSDVRSEIVTWLWRGRIPFGKITVLDGDPGLGKSMIATDLSARTSLATLMPDGTKSDLSEPSGVVLLSAEDDPADTIRPRLDVVGADCSRIVLLAAIRKEEGERLPTLLDLDAIRAAITAVNAKLVVIDPLMAYLPGKVDSHRDQDVRSVLALLAKLAAETGVAVLVVRHLNKATGGKALYRGGGSIGIIGAVRSGLVVAKDPENEERCILAMTKTNVAKMLPALAYHVIANANDIPSIVWEGVTEHTATSLLAAPVDGEEHSVLEEAIAFLKDVLSKGAVSSKDVQRQARDAGISDRTLRRAKDRLHIKVQKRGGFFSKDKESQQWCWVLPAPEDGQNAPEDGQEREFGHLQQSSEKNTRKFNGLPEGGQDSRNGHLQEEFGHLQGEFHSDAREPETEDVEVV